MEFDIKNFVGNPHDSQLADLYQGINNLVNIAGHVTIAELFQRSRRELGPDVWNVIQEAKPLGFLNLNNNSCCRGGECHSSVRGWCSRTLEGECAAASDSCEQFQHFQVGGRIGELDTGYRSKPVEQG